MSKRNIAWLVAVVAVGIGVGIAAGWVWGVLAALATLMVSELVERSRRRRLRAAQGVESAQSVTDAIGSRRRRR